MKRDLYNNLLEWKSSSTRKPLILQGARQVGKTYLINNFASQEYTNYILLNFDKDQELKKFFQDSLQPDLILEKLQIYTKQKISPQTTLLIFDEVQECPAALNSLKYFNEEANQYHIIAAGSLLGVKVGNRGFPVGKVNFLDLYPMSFFEFLNAIGEDRLREYIDNITTPKPLVEPFHSRLLELLKKYMIIGGMPEAVSSYVKENDMFKVREIQENILKAYELDFAQHAPPTELMRISQIWRSIPKQLSKENNKFVFSVVREGARGREYESALQWLKEAGLIIKSYNITAPKLPLPAYGDTNAFKVFALDVGLLAAMSNIPLEIILSDHELFNEYNGAFTENYVAQELLSKQNTLHYWTSEGIAEVDFIIQQNGKIFPLEVKSGISRRKKSLLVYDQKFHPELLLRSSSMNLKLDGKVLNLPLYLISNFNKYL